MSAAKQVGADRWSPPAGFAKILITENPTLKTNGPAATAIAPDRGSVNPEKDKNVQSNTTTENKKPARPTNDKIMDALFNVDCEITDLRNAVTVMDEYLNFEFRAGRGGPGPYEVGLTSEQVKGIEYLSRHVREVAVKVEKAFDKAFGREVSQ